MFVCVCLILNLYDHLIFLDLFEHTHFNDKCLFKDYVNIFTLIRYL